MKWYNDPEFWNDVWIICAAFLAGCIFGMIIHVVRYG